MSDERMKIPLPFTFESPFKKANEFTITIWINSYRKQNNRPVIVDWSAKALMNFMADHQRDRFLGFYNHHNLGIIRSNGEPNWAVRVASQAPEELTADDAKKSKLAPIRRLRGVFRGSHRKIPGWALDASFSQVATQFESHITGYGNNPVAFCLPDASDKTFMQMIEHIQHRIAKQVDHHLSRGYKSSLDAFTSPKYIVYVNPALEFKKAFILSLNKPVEVRQPFDKEPKRKYIIEPVHIKRAS
jgi:hypothetical protein